MFVSTSTYIHKYNLKFIFVDILTFQHIMLYNCGIKSPVDHNLSHKQILITSNKTFLISYQYDAIKKGCRFLSSNNARAAKPLHVLDHLQSQDFPFYFWSQSRRESILICRAMKIQNLEIIRLITFKHVCTTFELLVRYAKQKICLLVHDAFSIINLVPYQRRSTTLKCKDGS